MAHLATCSRGFFLVEMQTYPGYFKRRRKVWFAHWRVEPNLAQQVHNRARSHQRRIPERKIASSPHQLLELAGHASALTLVIAIVRTRRQLIYKKLTLPGHKH